MHVHLRHTDYLVLVDGAMFLGLCDLRAHSPTFQARASIRLSDERLQAIEIPPGVAHGFYFSERSVLLYGTSHFYDPSDELGCRWDDPPLAIAWPAADPVVSPRDRELGSFADLLAHFR
jgi:dTDP-4-dehydrorhamnose 3,5-epimerase